VNQFSRNVALWLVLGLMFLLLLKVFNTKQTNDTTISFSEFVAAAESGQIQEVEIQGQNIQGVYTGNERFRNNALFAIDGDIRIANAQRFFIPANDARLYGEFGWDDTCCSSAFIPLKEAASYLIGLHLLGLFGTEGLDWRFEYATSSRLSYTHNQFFNGYWTRGEVISHFMGREGSDIYTRVSQRFGAHR